MKKTFFDQTEPFAYKWYKPDRKVLGKRMDAHLRFAVCYWHSFVWPGLDPFGGDTFQRPWHAAGGDPNIAYYHSHWRLEPDQALIIEVMPPKCQHWNFQLNNYWMESLDYRYFTIHKNKHTTQLLPDGTARLVVAHRDPGVPNFIDTVGHTSGTMLFRWVGATEHPVPQTRVVSFEEARRLTH